MSFFSQPPATVISSVYAVGSYRQLVSTPATEIKREQVEWLLPERVPFGMLTILAGVGGLGKGMWSCLLASQTPGVTLIATAEDHTGATVRPRLEAVEADLARARFIGIKQLDIAGDGIAIPDDIALLEQLVEDLGARLVVIDPVVAHLPMRIDSHKDQGVRRALGPLSKLAERQDCAILGIVHLNKTQGLAPLARVGGSGAFGNAARSVLLLDRDPDDPEGEMGRRRVLAHIKCNVGAEAASLLYRVAPIILPAVDEQPEVETSRMELLGESNHSGQALLAGVVSEEERSEFEETCHFLLEELGDGQRHPAVDLYRDARKLGIDDRKLRRARKKIGAKTEKAGFGRGWEWWLPQGGDDGRESSGQEQAR